MKKSALLLIAIALPLACNKEVQAPEETTPAQAEQTASEAKIMEVTLTAVNESAATKTFFNKSTGAITWTASESNLAVFDGSAKQSFTHVETLEDGAKATFSGSADVAAPTWTAVHPASHAALEGGNIFVTFPCIQEARPAGGLKADINTSAAIVTHDGSGNIDDFTMKNIGGLLKLTVAKAGIKTITVSSVGGEALTGKAQLSFDGSGNPVVTPVATQFETFVTLKAADLASGLATGDYFVSVFPVSMASGLIIDMENIDGTVASVKSSTTATVARSADLEFAGFDTVASWYTPSETEYTFNFRTSGSWPFEESITSSSGDGAAWAGEGEHVMTYSSDNSIKFYLHCSNWATAKSAGNGMRFGYGVGDYLLLPAIQGKKLRKVSVTYSNADASNPTILTRGGTDEVIGGDNVSTNFAANDVQTWTLTGTANNTQYRYQLTKGSVAFIGSITLTYISKTPPIVIDMSFFNTETSKAVNPLTPVAPASSFDTYGTQVDFTSTAGTYKINDTEYTMEFYGAKARILYGTTNGEKRGLGMGTGLSIKLPTIPGYRLSHIQTAYAGQAAGTDDPTLPDRTLYISTTTTSAGAIWTKAFKDCSLDSLPTVDEDLDGTVAGNDYYLLPNSGWFYIPYLNLTYIPASVPAPIPAGGTPALLLDGGEFIL